MSFKSLFFCLTTFTICSFLFGMVWHTWAADAKKGETKPQQATNPKVLMKTNLGNITIELYPEQAPLGVANFLRYVDEKFYTGTIFHRVIDGFMIQGGGFGKDFVQKKPHAPIKNEAYNGLKNLKGTLAYARTTDVDSATSQFFINVADNTHLDHTARTNEGFGYCVFGKVIEGMNVVEKIKAIPTATKAGMQNVPTSTVEILSIDKM